MNKWEPLFWEGKNYLIVPSNDPNASSCKQCAFREKRNMTNTCPRYEGTSGTLYCIVHEGHIHKESFLIDDNPESIANYIASQLEDT